MSIEPVDHPRRYEHPDLSDPPRLLRVRREARALDILWSEGILDETTRNLIEKFRFTPEDADVLVERLEAYLPTALVDVKKRDEDGVAKVEMDAKDRHVLAAALSAKAGVLLTDNIGHFPKEWMARRGIELVDSGTLLLRLATECSDILREAHRLGVNSHPQTEEQVFAILKQITNDDVGAGRSPARLAGRAGGDHGLDAGHRAPGRRRRPDLRRADGGEGVRAAALPRAAVVFTSAPQFSVVYGRGWHVRAIDWSRRRA